MKGFVLGIVVTVVVIIAVGLFVAETGRVDMRADQPPSKLERQLAEGARDAYVNRNAPKRKNPFPVNDATLLAGAKIYADHCALCHGDPAHPESPLAHAFNPPPPQFMTNAADMGDRDNYYITEHGIRLTGMPAWGKILSTDQIWQVVTFAENIDNAPPDVKAVFALQAPSKEVQPSKKPAEKPRKRKR